MITWWVHGHDPAFLDETSGKHTDLPAIEAPPAEQPVADEANDVAVVAE